SAAQRVHMPNTSRREQMKSDTKTAKKEACAPMWMGSGKCAMNCAQCIGCFSQPWRRKSVAPVPMRRMASPASPPPADCFANAIHVLLNLVQQTVAGGPGPLIHHYVQIVDDPDRLLHIAPDLRSVLAGGGGRLFDRDNAAI